METPGNLVEEGARAAARLLDAADPPTAILAQADLLAAGAVQAAQARGLRVPGDVSVVGFDGLDLPWLAGHRLTTAAQPLEEKSRTVGRGVADLLNGTRPENRTFPVHLRPGTTTGPPPGER
jgi:DNA-binding LacI/PurR family transcriptional regulator